MEELNNYRWAGHCVIVGRVEQKWQDIDTVLRYFGRGWEAVVSDNENGPKNNNGRTFIDSHLIIPFIRRERQK